MLFDGFCAILNAELSASIREGEIVRYTETPYAGSPVRYGLCAADAEEFVLLPLCEPIPASELPDEWSALCRAFRKALGEH